MFGKNKTEEETAIEKEPDVVPASGVLIIGSDSFVETCSGKIPQLGKNPKVVSGAQLQPADFDAAESVVTLYGDDELLNTISREVKRVRELRSDGTPSLVIGLSLDTLAKFGAWLNAAADNDQLSGVRLFLADVDDGMDKLEEQMGPIHGPDIIKMPLMPEVADTDYKYFYTFSPELREAISLMGELAESNFTRLYLLGAPGTGKTSLAYYFWLKRNKGKFIITNLTAESTDDKAAMKSLLCGHVTGAFPGASSREGALSFAGEGVCFLDESHGVTGIVMQVLMEVLDSGQFMPFGGVAKRKLECAVVFASNRNWETLTQNINLDEHARIGATIIELADLVERKEDLLAVLAVTLDRFSKQYTTWTPPQGMTKEAWKHYDSSPWYGNTRALIRVTETSATNFARSKTNSPLIEESHVEAAMRQWEPEEHESLKVYSSTSRKPEDLAPTT